MTHDDPFRVRYEGDTGLSVDSASPAIVTHEVMYEDDITSVRDQRVFLGPAIPSRRFISVFIICGLLLGGLLLRSFWTQIIQGASYRQLAENNRLRHDVILPRRGLIRDRNGVVLAENVPSFDVGAIPRQLPADPNRQDEALAALGRMIGQTIGEIHATLASSTDPDDTVTIQRDVSYERAVAATIIAADYPGLTVTATSKRKYPLSTETPSLSHILGYVSGMTKDELATRRANGYRQTDLVGKTGVEATYESRLRGVPGERVYEVDSMHRVTATVGNREPVDGTDVRLTIDARLQEIAEQSLRTQLEKIHATRGAVVVLSPVDGSILAIVSLPAYDNAIFTGTVSSSQYAALLNNPDHPLLPRSWAGTYPSGSTIKPVIAAAALAEGVITPKTTVHSVGGIHVGPWFFPDWKAGGHGVVNVRSAIAWSVNTFFYDVGGGYDGFIGLGIDRLTKWMRTFGLGAKTGIDVPGEAIGFVPSQEWKKAAKGEQWFIGDTYNLSIGQGDLLVTPLQVAAYTSAIANGGHRVTPHLFADSTTTAVSNDLLAPADAIQTVRLGMRDTVVYGSGRALASLPIAVAGKTGTAQWRSDKANHAWFTSFGPFEKPEIVVAVLVEEGVEGSSTAVPVARDIYTAWTTISGMRH